MMRFLYRSVVMAIVVGFFPSSSSAHTFIHEVLPGQCLGDIASQYKTTVKKIKRYNRLRSNKLRAGHKLKIVTSYPARPQRKIRYRVKAGDSLAKIAAKHKMTLPLMRRLNRRAARGYLRPGQDVWVVVRGKRPSGRAVKDLIQLTSAPGYIIRDPKRAWGTFLTVNRLLDVMDKHRQAFPKAAPVRIHDISHKRGGYFYPHKSHRVGRDVDVVYPAKPKYGSPLRPSMHMIDPERTWFLVKAFLQTEDVVYIFMDKQIQKRVYKYAIDHGASKQELDKFFQYPGGRWGTPVRHDPGHDAHFHVRFRRAKKIPPPAA